MGSATSTNFAPQSKAHRRIEAADFAPVSTGLLLPLSCLQSPFVPKRYSSHWWKRLKRRLTLFSDAVYAVITLMVLDLRMPEFAGWEGCSYLLPRIGGYSATYALAIRRRAFASWSGVVLAASFLSASQFSRGLSPTVPVTSPSRSESWLKLASASPRQSAPTSSTKDGLKPRVESCRLLFTEMDQRERLAPLRSTKWRSSRLLPDSFVSK